MWIEAPESYPSSETLISLGVGKMMSNFGGVDLGESEVWARLVKKFVAGACAGVTVATRPSPLS